MPLDQNTPRPASPLRPFTPRHGCAVTLRPARAFDAPACAGIIDAWIAETPWVPRLHDLADIAWHLRNDVFPAQAVTVAERNAEVAGFIAVDGAGCVTSLYVARSLRCAGVGAMLIGSAKAEAARLRLWTFAANDAARRFYRREGFREGRRSDNDNAEGLPDIEFLWQRR